MTQQHPSLPHITKQQQTILEYIFTYRFLTTKHLQSHLKHKSKTRIQTWLNDLIAKEYIYQIYNPKIDKAAQTPATYHILINGIHYIRSLDYYPESELRKRYPDTQRSKSYIGHCLLMATICIDLKYYSGTDRSYSLITPSEYSVLEGDSYMTEYIQETRPDLYFARTAGTDVTQSILWHVYNQRETYRIRSRLKKFIKHDFYRYDDDAPTLLLLCDWKEDRTYVKRYCRYLLRKHDIEDAIIRVATTEQLLTEGTTAAIWEELEI